MAVEASKAGAAASTMVQPSHHLPSELLLDYAAGASSEAAALLVSSHLAFCPECRTELARQEALGGVLLAAGEPVELSQDALQRTLARLDVPAPTPRDTGELYTGELQSPIPGLPRPLARYLAACGGLVWRSLLPGVQEVRLPLVAGTGKTSLFRIRPGRCIPRHTHAGAEMTLVLRGSFQDSLGEFRAGDVAVTDETVEHRPMAGLDEPCLCLAVTEAPLRLTGRFGRLINPFFRF